MLSCNIHLKTELLQLEKQTFKDIYVPQSCNTMIITLIITMIITFPQLIKRKKDIQSLKGVTVTWCFPSMHLRWAVANTDWQGTGSWGSTNEAPHPIPGLRSIPEGLALWHYATVLSSHTIFDPHRYTTHISCSLAMK